MSPTFQADSLPCEPTGKPKYSINTCYYQYTSSEQSYSVCIFISSLLIGEQKLRKFKLLKIYSTTKIMLELKFKLKSFPDKALFLLR